MHHFKIIPLQSINFPSSSIGEILIGEQTTKKIWVKYEIGDDDIIQGGLSELFSKEKKSDRVHICELWSVVNGLTQNIRGMVFFPLPLVFFNKLWLMKIYFLDVWLNLFLLPKKQKIYSLI